MTTTMTTTTGMTNLMNLTSSMEVKLELATADELTKLLIALAESQTEFTLQKAERKNRGKSNKMDVLLQLHDSQSLLTLLQLVDIEFLLIKAEIKEPMAPAITINPIQPPTIRTQPVLVVGPYVYPPGTADPFRPAAPNTGDPLPNDWYWTTCASFYSITSVTPSSKEDSTNECTVDGVAYDNFMGNSIN